jgi:hypothetical protein
MKIIDRSLPNSGGTLTGNRGCPGDCEYTGASQNPQIIGDKNFTEVALVEGDQEPCAAASVGDGGHVRAVNTKAEGAQEAPRGPAIAFLSKGSPMSNGVTAHGATHGVQTHPQLQRANQSGSYTKDDHVHMHGDMKSNHEPSAKSNLPKGGEGVEEALDDKCAAQGAAPSTIGSPSSNGSTMPSVTQKAFSDTPVIATPTGQAMRSRD